MLQMKLEYLDNEKNVSVIVEKAKQVLAHRQDLYNRYKRNTNAEIKVPLEYYIANIATGYFGGKAPKFTVKQERNEKKKNIVQKLFDKIIGENADADEFKMLIDYINDYNDLPAFFYELIFDYMTTNACYWIEYETEQNEIVFARVPSLQTVAIYDYSTPIQKIGGIRIWTETDEQGFDADMVEIITANSKRYYKNRKEAPDEYKEDVSAKEDVKWDLVPFNAVENPDELCIYEPVLSLIDAYETVIKNNKHLFEYNDDAKLKITGFTPQNPLMVQNDKGKWIKNPDRAKEDELILQAPTFYTPDNTGDIDWITKDINDTASENHKKTLIELILMISMIPSISEISTTEKTATEIERSFFPLEQVLTRADKLFKKELLSMWENIIGRINLKKSTKYDFRDIQIELERNLPTDKDSVVEIALKLREVLSDETVLKMLPFDIDIESELAKKEEENAENFNDNIERIQNATKTNSNNNSNITLTNNQVKDEKEDKDVGSTK